MSQADKPFLEEVDPSKRSGHGFLKGAPPADDFDFDVQRDVEPLTLSALGKLFGVPLIIIATIVGGAVLVVLLFGAPTLPERRSVERLMQELESNSGERSLGVLLPREKQLWQTALELCERLTKQGEEFSTEELSMLADRLSSLVRTDLNTQDRLPTLGAERENQRQIRSRRLEFTIHALGRTRQPSAVPTLIEVINTAPEPYAAVALRELGDLRELPETRAAADSIIALLERAARDETKLVATTVLSVLAAPGDAAAVEALNRIRLTGTGDVSWSAALALARLGSLSGKSTLLDLLDRTFWERDDRYQTVDRAGAVRRYPMPQSRIEQWLIATIDASRALDDADVRMAIEALVKDPSLAVRAKAEEARRLRSTLTEAQTRG